MLNIKKFILLFFKVEIKNFIKIDIIVNSRVQLNIILVIVVKKQNLIIYFILKIILLFLNRLDYTIYRFIVIEIYIKNLKNRVQIYKILFIVTNFKKLLIYLKLF